MSLQRDTAAALFTRVDVTPTTHHASIAPEPETQTDLLREVLNAQDRTNDLLESLASTLVRVHKQRTRELNKWRNANPTVSDACRDAAEALSRVQVDFLERMTEEINDAAEELIDSDFMLNEFIDRFGPRLAHLNGMIQVLGQLGNANEAFDAEE